MCKYIAFILTFLFFSLNCFADTFTHKNTGETFNGYVVQRKKGNKTQVRIENNKVRYVNLGEFNIAYNNLGRRNKVFVFSLTSSIELICETEAFEKAIAVAADRGPIFVLIEIDTPGGRADLAQRICSAINKINYCKTVAFVSGEKFGGAFSAGAIIAMACDTVFIKKGAAIGAAAPYVQTSIGPRDLERIYGQVISEKINSAWSAFCAAIAERNNRSGLLARAMVDSNIEVLEIQQNGKMVFVDAKNKDPNIPIVRTWSEKGSLLTLTAVEADKSGIADKEILSRDDIFTELGAVDAQKVTNNNGLKAKRIFQKAEKQLNTILPTIEYLRERANTLLTGLNKIDEQIRSSNNLTYRRGSTAPVFRYRYGTEGQLPYTSVYSDFDSGWDEIFIDREEVIAELLFVLEELMVQYRRALNIAEKHADLQHHVVSFQKDLKFTDATYRDIRFRP